MLGSVPKTTVSLSIPVGTAASVFAHLVRTAAITVALQGRAIF